MQILRNGSFVVMCLAFAATGRLGFAEDMCTAPGLVGLGDSEASAIQACMEYGSGATCLIMCETACGYPQVLDPYASCDAIGQGSEWSAFGRCHCRTTVIE